jgi:cell fate regulator YaaT (PSP1 superfamily)
MSDVVKVRFKGSRRGFYTNPSGFEIKVGDYVVVDGERGREIGKVLLTGDLARRVGRSDGKKLAKVLKLATEEEKERLREMRRLERKAKQVCQQKIFEKRLAMNLVDVECNYELNRLSFYFTAEKRVDFRGLIRDMAQIFRKRIKLRQIGVRDKAKRTGGFGRCGNPLCCSTFLSEFEPVTLKAAKEQNLSLNPTNISGCCGRLMCCLMFERDFYRTCGKRFPPVGKEVLTVRGKERIVANDIFRDRVALRGRNGEKRVIPLKEFQREWKRCRGCDRPGDG